MTIKDVVDEYVKTFAGKSSQDEVKRALYKDLVPVWGMRNPERIALHERVLLPDRIAEKTFVLADRLYASLQKPAPEAEIRNNADKVLLLIQRCTPVHSINEKPSGIMDDVVC